MGGDPFGAIGGYLSASVRIIEPGFNEDVNSFTVQSQAKWSTSLAAWKYTVERSALDRLARGRVRRR
jgi:hypothetical protein